MVRSGRGTRVVSCGLVVALVLALAACGSSGGKKSAATTTVPLGGVSAAEYKEAARLVNVGAAEGAAASADRALRREDGGAGPAARSGRERHRSDPE